MSMFVKKFFPLVNLVDQISTVVMATRPIGSGQNTLQEAAQEGKEADGSQHDGPVGGPRHLWVVYTKRIVEQYVEVEVVDY